MSASLGALKITWCKRRGFSSEARRRFLGWADTGVSEEDDEELLGELVTCGRSSFGKSAMATLHTSPPTLH